jgi:anti-anti-sigma factor
MRTGRETVTAAFDVRRDDDGVLWLSGELDIAQVDTFLRAGTEELERGDALVLDLSSLSFIDSSGIRATLQLAERADGGRIMLRRPSEGVRKVLDLTGIVGRAGISLEES